MQEHHDPWSDSARVVIHVIVAQMYLEIVGGIAKHLENRANMSESLWRLVRRAKEADERFVGPDSGWTEPP